jgi:rhamnose utilization protein RhaD (predicted bifunctional aldolase and dehydrogenase)
MKNLFDPQDAENFVSRYPEIPSELALRVYTSRLIGGDPSLVLHGGGNTSVKVKGKNLLGEEEEILYIKGSGIDLATIEPAGFAGLEWGSLRKLKKLSALSDEEMENQLRIHKIRSSSPDPSVEALLHAFLPHRYIDHTHADLILALTNQKQRKDLLKEALGSRIAVLPYLTPGLALAKAVAEICEKSPDSEAVVVCQHGIFTFGEDARTAYERMLDYVGRAEAFLKRKAQGGKLGVSPAESKPPEKMATSLARFNQAIRGACAFQSPEGLLRRFYAEVRASHDLAKAASASTAPRLCSSGVLTPDHVIRTKNKWVSFDEISEDDNKLKQAVREAVRVHVEEYGRTFSEQSRIKGIHPEKLDPYPRVFLVAEIGRAHV